MVAAVVVFPFFVRVCVCVCVFFVCMCVFGYVKSLFVLYGVFDGCFEVTTLLLVKKQCRRIISIFNACVIFFPETHARACEHNTQHKTPHTQTRNDTYGWNPIQQKKK